MRIGRLNGRLVIKDGDGVIDAATVSGGEFSADPDQVFAVWDRFTEWAGGHAGPGTHTGPLATPAGEVPGSGRSFQIHGAAVLEVQDGRIAAERLFFDVAQFMSQLGFAR